MTRWRPFLDDDTLRPGPELVAALSADLRSPDPAVRDEQAYVLLHRWIPRLPAAERHRLGDEMADRFTDPEIQARTFAPLVLARLVRLGDHDPAWQRAFDTWYRTEPDLRGHDPELGWLHAVAHGADLLGALGRSPHTEPADLLDLACARLLAPTEHLFDAMEDDRLGLAIALTLTRPELTRCQSVDWLAPVAADFAAAYPDPSRRTPPTPCGRCGCSTCSPSAVSGPPRTPPPSRSPTPGPSPRRSPRPSRCRPRTRADRPPPGPPA
ncbi:DUF2785 domain-containing protein [Kitasatospora arboriphila]